MKLLAILLLFVPAAITAEFLHANPVLIFALSALAIVPLSGFLGHATEEISTPRWRTRRTPPARALAGRAHAP